jgi:hypothetical protein
MGERQNTTDRHTPTDDDSQLSRSQLDALGALGTGATVTEAARRAGVDRTTLHRWLRRDYAFQASWNRMRRELKREVESGVERLASAALKAVEDAIAGGDIRASLAVLKGVGFLSGDRRPIGPEDPEEVATEDRLVASEAEADKSLRKLISQLRV